MATHNNRGHFSLRGFASLLIAIFSVLLVVTGTILYVTPQGRIAHWTSWSFMGLGKEEWSGLHINISLVFVAVAVLHLYLNWRIFWSYITTRLTPGFNQKREAMMALAVALLVVAGTYFEFPPFSTIVNWNDDIKVYWAKSSPHPPYPHAEDSTLTEFAKRLRLPPGDLNATLREEGYRDVDMERSMADVAIRNGVAPNDLFEAVKKRHPETLQARTGSRK